jgi:hypothetical protein
MYQTDIGTAHPVLLNRLSKVNISCGLAMEEIWSNRAYVALALSSMLSTCVVF